MRIYVASSWRNNVQPSVVAALREAGHEVYDFKNPRPGDNGFHWSEIDPAWKGWHPEAFRAALDHPVARAGFRSDMDALEGCDACVCVLPCGRSAHLELGWALGAGKRTAIFIPQAEEPELMYRMLHRAAAALGYWEAWTYTLPHEPGTSLRAAGFKDMGMTTGGEHDRKGRPRLPAEQPGPKRRWRRILRAPRSPSSGDAGKGDGT